MIERGQDVRFAREPRAAIRVAGDVRRQNLHRDFTSQLRVTRAIHLAHAAGAEQTDDFVGADTDARCEAHVCLGARIIRRGRGARR